jgi:predicted transposase YbfD/YdcC
VAEKTSKKASLVEALESVRDHRRSQGKRYPIGPLLAFVCAAMLANRRGLRPMLEWGRDIGRELLGELGLRRVPGLGTFSRFMAGLDVESFENALASWVGRVTPVRDGRRCLALDGKTLRGSSSGELPGVHLIALFDPLLGCVVAEKAVDRKTNEHKAALELIRGMVLDGVLVTGDAAFAQRDLCASILARDGDYLVTVKDNQPTLKQDCEAAFMPPDSPSGQGAARHDRCPRRQRRQGARKTRAADARGDDSTQRLP